MKTPNYLSLRTVILIIIAGYSSLAAAIVQQLPEPGNEDGLGTDYGLITGVSQPASCSPNQIIVKFNKELPADYAMAMLLESGCRLVDTCASGDFHLVEIPESETPQTMAEYLSQSDAFEYAELNPYVAISFVPNDTFYTFQWHLDNPRGSGINMEAAWDIQAGDPNVIVAVLDTGVAYENFESFRQAPDLAATSFAAGYDFVNNDSHPNDDQGHGTHVAGTIAQSTNNSLGVGGVAFGCSIMPVKVIDETGTGSHFHLAAGIFFAVKNGAKVINMSLGGPEGSMTLRRAVAFAHEQGVTIVCAAGNEFFADNAPSYPAAYDDYCIAVAATRYDRRRAPYSNTGSYVDIAAPGGDMTVDQNGDGYPDGVLQQTFGIDPNTFVYRFLEGTSMAAPHVSGAAALIISNGRTSPCQVRQALEDTARDFGARGWDEEYGWGLLDVASALNYELRTDVNGDCMVDAEDITVIVDSWLEPATAAPAADINDDGVVDLADFAVFAESW